MQRYKAGTDIFDPYTKFDNSIEKGKELYHQESKHFFMWLFVIELFYLRQNDLGPFGSMNTKIADFIYTLVEMKLEFSLRNYDIRYQNKYCYVWDVMVRFDWIIMDDSSFS